MSDTSWLIYCFVLVLFMQGGFLCLECGQVRIKNSVNVALKNITDFVLTLLAFWLIGYGIMFGDSYYGLFGSNHFLMSGVQNSNEIAFFLFQSAFSATAVTLTAGSVSERMKFSAYLWMIVLISFVLYPLFGHWAWGGTINPGNQGFLQALGFIDFAGSTVVHSLGGWVALAAALILGPRMGRFNATDGHVVIIHGSNYGLAMFGAILLIIGWVGFNAGSALSFSEKVPLIIFNTLLAGCCGGVTVMVWNMLKGNTIDAMEMLNGILAGMVAITAGCHIVQAYSAMLIGIGGAITCLLVSCWLKSRQIDDAIDAVPVHLGAGIWGTLSVAIFADMSDLPASFTRGELFMAQLTGITICAIFSFGISYAFLFYLDRIYRIRVGNEQERVGLDVALHGIPDPLKAVSSQIEHRIAKYGIEEDERSVYSATHETISNKYEHVIKAMEKNLESRQAELDHMRILSNNDSLTDVANRRFYNLSMEREFNNANRYNEPLSLVLIDIDYFKQFNDTYGHHLGDKCLITLATVMKQVFQRSTDMIARLGGDEFAVILPKTDNKKAVELATLFKEEVTKLQLENINSPLQDKVISVSLGVSTHNPIKREMQEHTDLYIACDEKLYFSKGSGRNRIAT